MSEWECSQRGSPMAVEFCGMRVGVGGGTGLHVWGMACGNVYDASTPAGAKSGSHGFGTGGLVGVACLVPSACD